MRLRKPTMGMSGLGMLLAGVAATSMLVAGGCGAGQQPLDLRVVIQGEGVVTSQPSGIFCRSDMDAAGICAAVFESGVDVELIATPAEGWRFARWEVTSEPELATVVGPVNQNPARAQPPPAQARVIWTAVFVEETGGPPGPPPPQDAGDMTDAGELMDAGAEMDAGEPMDAGAEMDAGELPDAGDMMDAGMEVLDGGATGPDAGQTDAG